MDIGWKRDHLWLYVLALGFDPGADDGDLLLGTEMFDEPNNSAFHVIALFLLAKLDQSRAEAAFGDCSLPGGSNFIDPEFRKQCCMWLKDIANEDQSCLPQFTPSAFISPAGPKFIHLFYRFARHVVVEDMKTNSVGTDIPFAEAVKLTPEDKYMANARCRVAYNKLLQIFQKEDFVIQEYEKKAQLLIKEIKQIKSEYAVLEMQSCMMKQSDQNKNDKTERIQKVRSMWTLIMEMLISLKKEKEVVDSVLDVLEDCFDECVLDGTNVVFSVPQLLAHRVENDIHQPCTGNVYEAEKLNFLTVIQLLNEALRTLRDDLCQFELKNLLQVIEDSITFRNEVRQNLEEKRLNIEQQRCVSMSGSISRKQQDWEVKWKRFHGLCPFNLILYQDSELDLFRASPPHFNPAEQDEDSVFCQHLLSVPEVCDSIHEVHYEKDDGSLETMMDESTPPPRGISSVPLELSKASENRDVLIEKNLHIETCKGKKKPVPPTILKNGKDESAISETWENAGDHVIQTESPVRKEDPLKKARDELAEEVAKTVISESPQSGEGKGVALEDLISSLAFNPFLTRKQIPRTPENLLTEIRSSWRKAIQTEGSSDIELAPAEVIIEEAPVATPVKQKAADSRFVCPVLASSVPLFDPPLSERKSQLSSTELRPQEQMRISHIIESPVSETSGMRESERTEAQELKCVVLNKSSVEDPEEQTFQYVKESMNTPDICSENDSRTNVLPSDHFQGSLMGGMLHRNASPLLSSICREGILLGILDETLPEELDNIDTNKSASSESHFDVIDSTYVTDSSKNKGDIKESKLDLQSLFDTYKALKKTASRSEEELHQICNGGESVSCRSDLSLAPEKRERGELCGPLELFCLDEEFTKTPSPKSFNERKYSLSSLLVSCQHLEEMASMVHEIPLDLMHKLKDKEQLNEKTGTKEPSG
ncbi:HAUS augmin-like complex subunit 6 [Gymnogyps californianus]|uniref:HAUS augmin-like complex subunit 6 n=1 Tax=Gymnogyps californianus TaxID=33616 RepID=UPI0021CA8D83|nr:HAUS augmin-like complex subunit 6 [Gymnogyps californianus]